jgi:hypothetical protein
MFDCTVVHYTLTMSCLKKRKHVYVCSLIQFKLYSVGWLILIGCYVTTQWDESCKDIVNLLMPSPYLKVPAALVCFRANLSHIMNGAYFCCVEKFMWR